MHFKIKRVAVSGIGVSILIFSVSSLFNYVIQANPSILGNSLNDFSVRADYLNEYAITQSDVPLIGSLDTWILNKIQTIDPSGFLKYAITIIMIIATAYFISRIVSIYSSGRSIHKPFYENLIYWFIIVIVLAVPQSLLNSLLFSKDLFSNFSIFTLMFGAIYLLKKGFRFHWLNLLWVLLAITILGFTKSYLLLFLGFSFLVSFFSMKLIAKVKCSFFPITIYSIILILSYFLFLPTQPSTEYMSSVLGVDYLWVESWFAPDFVEVIARKVSIIQCYNIEHAVAVEGRFNFRPQECAESIGDVFLSLLTSPFYFFTPNLSKADLFYGNLGGIITSAHLIFIYVLVGSLSILVFCSYHIRKYWFPLSVCLLNILIYVFFASNFGTAFRYTLSFWLILASIIFASCIEILFTRKGIIFAWMESKYLPPFLLMLGCTSLLIFVRDLYFLIMADSSGLKSFESLSLILFFVILFQAGFVYPLVGKLKYHASQSTCIFNWIRRFLVGSVISLSGSILVGFSFGFQTNVVAICLMSIFFGSISSSFASAYFVVSGKRWNKTVIGVFLFVSAVFGSLFGFYSSSSATEMYMFSVMSSTLLFCIPLAYLSFRFDWESFPALPSGSFGLIELIDFGFWLVIVVGFSSLGFGLFEGVELIIWTVVFRLSVYMANFSAWGILVGQAAEYSGKARLSVSFVLELSFILIFSFLAMVIFGLFSVDNTSEFESLVGTGFLCCAMAVTFRFLFLARAHFMGSDRISKLIWLQQFCIFAILIASGLLIFDKGKDSNLILVLSTVIGLVLLSVALHDLICRRFGHVIPPKNNRGFE